LPNCICLREPYDTTFICGQPTPVGK
jgi:hypothetical protein